MFVYPSINKKKRKTCWGSGRPGWCQPASMDHGPFIWWFSHLYGDLYFYSYFIGDHDDLSIKKYVFFPLLCYNITGLLHCKGEISCHLQLQNARTSTATSKKKSRFKIVLTPKMVYSWKRVLKTVKLVKMFTCLPQDIKVAPRRHSNFCGAFWGSRCWTKAGLQYFWFAKILRGAHGLSELMERKTISRNLHLDRVSLKKG